MLCWSSSRIATDSYDVSRAGISFTIHQFIITRQGFAAHRSASVAFKGFSAFKTSEALLREPKAPPTLGRAIIYGTWWNFSPLNPPRNSDEPGTSLKQEELCAIQGVAVMDSFSNYTEKFDILTS
jgi:hypothetical protein